MREGGQVNCKEATETSRCDNLRKRAGKTPHIDGNKHVWLLKGAKEYFWICTKAPLYVSNGREEEERLKGSTGPKIPKKHHALLTTKRQKGHKVVIKKRSSSSVHIVSPFSCVWMCVDAILCPLIVYATQDLTGLRLPAHGWCKNAQTCLCTRTQTYTTPEKQSVCKDVTAFNDHNGQQSTT